MPGDRGQGRVRVCHREIHKLLGYNVWLMICYQQTTKCKAFSIKTLAFVDLYSEGAEPKRKMFAETETRVISIPPSSEWMLDRLIFSPGCLNSSDLKVSLTSFTEGKKKAVKCHARHKQEWNLKLATSRAKLATRQGLSRKLSWEHHFTCTPAFSGWTISIFTTWGRSYSLFCLGQDPGYWHCKLRVLLKISCLLSSKCHWAQSWDR